MKKIVLSVLAIGAFAFTANAQTPDIKFGAKAGVNFSNLSKFDDSKMKVGFHVGALAEIFINEKFSVQPELLYSAQGAKFEYQIPKLNNIGMPVGFETKTGKLELNYINVPIMAKYYVMDGLSVQAGPQVGFLVSAKSEGENVKDEYNSVAFDFNVGAGYELPMGVFFDARYNIGISNVDKKIEGYQLKAKNGTFQVSVGYKF